jgi:hypothetical protein
MSCCAPCAPSDPPTRTPPRPPANARGLPFAVEVTNRWPPPSAPSDPSASTAAPGSSSRRPRAQTAVLLGRPQAGPRPSAPAAAAPRQQPPRPLLRGLRRAPRPPHPPPRPSSPRPRPAPLRRVVRQGRLHRVPGGGRRLPRQGRAAPRQVRPLDRERSTARTAWACSRPIPHHGEAPAGRCGRGPSAFPASRCRPW